MTTSTISEWANQDLTDKKIPGCFEETARDFMI